MEYSYVAAVFVIQSQLGPAPQYKVDIISEIQCTKGLPQEKICVYLRLA
jgi:hypothetical protein